MVLSLVTLNSKPMLLGMQWFDCWDPNRPASAEDSRILGGYDFQGWTRSNGQPLEILVGDEIQKTIISV